jgi:hypothetical protein
VGDYGRCHTKKREYTDVMDLLGRFNFFFGVWAQSLSTLFNNAGQSKKKKRTKGIFYGDTLIPYAFSLLNWIVIKTDFNGQRAI